MTADEPKPRELHLFILWQNGLNAKGKVLEELNSRGFTGITVQGGDWSNTHFRENLRRFYAMEKSAVRTKLKETGIGPFVVITFWDEAPTYEFRETSRGFQWVNGKVFDLKADFRSKIFGRNVVHGTNSAEEAARDFFLIYGVPYDRILREGIDSFTPRKKLAGVGGWESVAEVFELMNHCDTYVVMRNFQGLPEKLSLSDHGDIDFLTESWRYTKNLLGAEPVFRQPYRRHLHLNMRSGEKLPIDIRDLGDNYYDCEWQQHILDNRELFNGFYVPNEEDHRFSLIYHALIQKVLVAPDYTRTLTHEGTSGRDLTWDDNLRDLHRFMAERDYSFVPPHDPTVNFDDRYLGSRIKTQIREIEALGFCEVEAFKIDAWKNQFKACYFKGLTADGRPTFFKCAGLAGSARREYKILKAVREKLPDNFPEPFSYSDDEKNILAISFVQGCRLDTLIEDGLLDSDGVARLKASLFKILACLQEMQILHRDIRPENLMVDKDFNVTLIDFQCAISLKKPRFKEYKAIKKKIRQIKRLGGHYSVGRYAWDDAHSVALICAHLDRASGQEVQPIDKELVPVGKLTWRGRRNNFYDLVTSWLNNYLRSKFRKDKQPLGL